MSKKILFVDDEPAALKSLERVVQSFRSEWNLEFAEGGQAALDALNRGSFDAVVTDMRMPEVSGADLLRTLKRQFPDVLRFALFAESDQESMMQALTVAHHSLRQPCLPIPLRNELRRAFALQDALTDKKVKGIIASIDHLPSAPSVYTELVEAMQSPACTIGEVSGIVERDMAIAAKLLQLANSPLFGFRFQLSSLAHAVSLLGMDTVKSLTLSVGVFSQLTGGPAEQAEALALWEHSVLISRVARRIAEVIGLERRGAEDSFTAGLLHDIGRLVLATQLPKQWAEVKAFAEAEKFSLSDAEWKVLSCSQDEIAAYLLESWGLPTAIVEAVAWRATPSLSQVRKPGPLAALHIAHCGCAKITPSERENPELDKDFLQICGLDTREQEFFDTCEKLARKDS